MFSCQQGDYNVSPNLTSTQYLDVMLKESLEKFKDDALFSLKIVPLFGGTRFTYTHVVSKSSFYWIIYITVLHIIDS